MKTFNTIAIALLFAFSSIIASAQTSQIRKLSGFTGVDVNEGITLELTFGATYAVEVLADDDIIEQVMTEIKSSELNIYMKGNNFKLKNKEVIVKVTSPEISSIKSSSGASCITQNLIESNQLKMSVSSGATLKVAFKAPQSSCSASSGASAKIKGVTKFFKADASSGSSINAQELVAVNVTAEASSGANVSVSCEEEINADASSGGSIKYYGSPSKVDVDKSSGGSVNRGR